MKKTRKKNIGDTSPRKHTGKITNRKKLNDKVKPNIKKDAEKREEPPAAANLKKSDKNNHPKLSNNILKKQTFVSENSRTMNDQNVGIISREDLNHMFQGFFEDSNTIKQVQPINLPG